MDVFRELMAYLDHVTLQSILVVLGCICLSWKIIEHMWSFLKLKEPVRVLVTGAAGQIGYALVPMIARGVMLGPDQPVILHILDILADALKGVEMELIDSAFPLLKGMSV
ncbi:hypothetical protein SLEP1_g23907 [Rubroshorea leprosula]|uniref:Lactate/malate dehydrogenase N-terminal domain-containing protein n=1 Tax=Rubroshorea leprosula TaxID=152421 RepID=A0AAV5JN23_9ROSI|nr:hypothetical protein SLEP1_g23907 [Rubroshorea leprosula]